jgi:hypothetical protein
MNPAIPRFSTNTELSIDSVNSIDRAQAMRPHRWNYWIAMFALVCTPNGLRRPPEKLEPIDRA